MGRFFGLRSRGNIVAMKPRLEPSNARSLLWQMEAYWRALPRTVGPVPRRTDVDPRGVDALLRYAIILERVAPGVARFRIAGQHMTDLTGMEVRGMPISALFSTQSRDPFCAALSEMFDRPAILQARLTARSGKGRHPICGQMMLLPLCLETGEISRAMGAIITNADKGSEPQRLHADAFQLRPLLVRPDSDFAVEGTQGGSAFAEEATPLRGQPPKLRIVHSSD